ncbi:MAG: hemerythrin domain-containing protein [Armatimonadetes bacterium]|nr:hemerythrin domain-containing protein [Armatimonadota bacterium]
MDPIETLRHEHDVILLVLEAADQVARSLPAKLRTNPAWLDEFIDFARNFADRCHHGKEERHLFVRLEQRGIPREGGPIGVMLLEHDQGRAFVRAVADSAPAAKAGDILASEAVARNLSAYVELLRSHIAKENDVLFVMAKQVLTATDLRELEAAFERVETEEMGEGVHERYYELAHRLAGH